MTTRSKTLHSLSPLIWLYRIAGVFPITNNLKVNKVGLFYSSTLILGFISLSFLSSYYAVGIYLKNNLTIKNSLEVFCSHFVSQLFNVIILYFILHKSKKLIYFFKELEKIDLFYLKFKSNSKQLFAFQFMYIILVVSAILMLYSKVTMSSPLFGFIPFQVLLTIIRGIELCSENLVITCYILLKQRFQFINKQLKQLLCINTNKLFINSNKDVFLNICSLRQAHLNLELLIKKANKIFNIIVISSLLSSFGYFVLFYFFILNVIFFKQEFEAAYIL